MSRRTTVVLLCIILTGSEAHVIDRRTLLASAKKSGKTRTSGKPEACTGKSIYILDLNDFAEENDVPTCDIAKVIHPGVQSQSQSFGQALSSVQVHLCLHSLLRLYWMRCRM